MKCYPILLSLFFCGQVGGDPAPEFERDLAYWLTPSKCVESDPDSLYIKHIEADGGDSEQARDEFFGRYADVLSKRTDQEHPEAARFRKPLLEAFKETFEFIRTANGGSGTAHRMSRLPAELEHDISEGFKSDFENDFSGEFTTDHIKQLGGIYLQSQARSADGRDLSDLNLESALEKLSSAEKSMTKEAVIYFRVRIIRLIMEYMVR